MATSRAESVKVSDKDPLLGAAYGLTPFASAAHSKVPDDAWEYQIRKSLGDAAYNSLNYSPYCSCTPTCIKCEKPKWMWKRK